MSEDASHQGGPEALDPMWVAAELAACEADPAYFIHHHCWLKNDQSWERFLLWPEQVALVDLLHGGQRTVNLKARQLGATWVAVGYALWLMTFRPGSTILFISLREEEAIPLVEERLKGMHARLPDWLRVTAPSDGAKKWRMDNGSVARALPSNRGDSYTASLVVVDEADLIPKLGKLLGSLEPTINDGGKIFLNSRSDKSRPNSTFKRIFRGAWTKPQESPWRACFMPWYVRPGRDSAWYERQRRASLENDGTLDQLHEQYPATPEEALAPSASNKRLPAAWLAAVTQTGRQIIARGAPPVPGLRVYQAPAPGRTYAIGVDCAAGLPTSDDSAAVVVDKATAREVAVLQGKLDASGALPDATAQLARWYNHAAVLVERNNHGDSTLAALRGRVTLVRGPDGREGYNKDKASKHRLWNDVASMVRDRWLDAQGGHAVCPMICDLTCAAQVASLEAATCKAPDNGEDDVADAWGLAQWAAIHHQDNRISRARVI